MNGSIKDLNKAFKDQVKRIKIKHLEEAKE